MEFNPARNLAQARESNPALDAAYTRVEEEKEKYLNPIVQYFSRLLEEVAAMPIAQRFSRDRSPNFMFSVTGQGSMDNPLMEGLTEAEYKRAQLAFDIVSVRSDVMHLISAVEAIVLDMEATKTD